MKSKADYYQWLMNQHRAIEEKLNAVPKLSLEEQSKSAMVKEYNHINQKQVNELKDRLTQIETEAVRIQQ